MARLRGGAFTIAVPAALLCVIATRSSAHPAKGQVDAWLAHARAARQGMAVMALGFAGHDQQAAMCQRHGLRARAGLLALERSEEHTSELQSLMRISYAVFCLKKKKSRDIESKQGTQQHTE